MNNIVLTDCDGVLLNWRDSFDSWMMRQHGIFATGDVRVYDQTERYEDEEIWKKIVEFNSSAVTPPTSVDPAMTTVSPTSLP